MNIYVFRINYDDYYGLIKQDIDNGLLRQGWGASGMSIENDFEIFNLAWSKEWGENNSPIEKRKNKFNRISLMKEMQSGDLIVIPKIDIFSLTNEYNGSCFSILQVTGKYQFRLPNWCDDFGHTIPVKKVISCDYDYDINSKVIKAKLCGRAYSNPINHVYNQDFLDSINDLIKYSFDNNNNHLVDKQSNSISELYKYTKNKRNEYKKLLLDSLYKLGHDALEKIIIELFSKNGYELFDNNKYDREGGDIDGVFVKNNDSFLNTLLDNSDTNVEIWVQAKCKGAKDNYDKEGVEQLIKMLEKSDNNSNIIPILINIQESEFNKDTIKLAENNQSGYSILLISGPRFVDILMQFGFDDMLYSVK